ncbi:MAG: ATP-dependent metallopeptidase FtsH/Yme1/Tma family protein [Nitrospirae bacterium]|nr:ATP-dependent metallopeptidase FtsH/Yme1/Tma family protein [Nitrospirota bacterium]MBI5695916.1 ATP-dependent zinc metalloprotease FtsH [Nitrospirota bacterium]
MNSNLKNFSLILLLVLIMVLIYHLFSAPQKPEKELIYSDFIAKVELGDVSEALLKEDEQGVEVIGLLKSGENFRSFAPKDTGLVKSLSDKGVKITAQKVDANPWYSQVLFFWAPIILMIGFWIFFMRQMQAGGNKAMSFGKSRAKLLTESTKKVTFADVAGIEEPKEELHEIIEYLKDPQKFQKLGGRIPKGVLLVGPPGTGKTLLAKAIAGEAEVPFFSISGSDFVEMFVGVGASRVRDLFEQGKKNAPCIIFIDELDAVGRHRGAGLGGGHDEREQTLNQLLVEMDGFESNEGVILISATNRPDVLDPALLRPGRFDRQVVVPRPDIKGREGILKVHTRKVPMDENVELSVIARGTPGFAGADLANLVNEAALLAARKGHEKVGMDSFEQAKDKVMMGAERRSIVISDKEKKNTAYHEAGHTLMAKLIPGADPIHKVTIIPRGRALGLTWSLPLEERYTDDRDHLLGKVAMLLGGRLAEELALNHMTTGAGNDLERATDLVRRMVCEWGMSDALGPLTFGKKEEQIFLGREIAQHRDFSEKTAVEIDAEVRRMVMEAYERGKSLMTGNMAGLDALAAALLDRETIDGKEVDAILAAAGIEVATPAPAEGGVTVGPVDGGASVDAAEATDATDTGSRADSDASA